MAMVRGKPGHPEWVPTKEEIEDVTIAARNGCTHEEIAAYLGIGLSTFQDKLNKYPEMRDALQKGKFKAKNLLLNVLFEKGLNGDNGAAFFMLERRYDCERTSKLHLTDTTQIDKDIQEKALETFKNDCKADY